MVLLSIGVALVALAVALLARGDEAEIAIGDTAARVEQVRGLTFKELPVAVRVSQETASEGVAAPPEVEQAMLAALGLVATGEEPAANTEVYGAYDSSEGRIEIADDGPKSGPLFELTLAHELAHALDDQHFGFPDTEGLSDDAALAVEALVEGTAMRVERDYIDRYLAGEPAYPWSVDEAATFYDRDARFVYEKGEQFVAALRAAGRGTWSTVNQAISLQPPRSTEQVLHLRKWRTDESPMDVMLPRVALGAGWRRMDVGVWGEWRTGALVGEWLAQGWGGDRFELWRRGRHHTLVMRWVWDTKIGAQALAEGLRERPFARRPGARIWIDGTTVTLVIAPSNALSTRVS